MLKACISISKLRMPFDFFLINLGFVIFLSRSISAERICFKKIMLIKSQQNQNFTVFYKVICRKFYP